MPNAEYVFSGWIFKTQLAQQVSSEDAFADIFRHIIYPTGNVY